MTRTLQEELDRVQVEIYMESCVNDLTSSRLERLWARREELLNPTYPDHPSD